MEYTRYMGIFVLYVCMYVCGFFSQRCSFGDNEDSLVSHWVSEKQLPSNCKWKSSLADFANLPVELAGVPGNLNMAFAKHRMVVWEEVRRAKCGGWSYSRQFLMSHSLWRSERLQNWRYERFETKFTSLLILAVPYTSAAGILLCISCFLKFSFCFYQLPFNHS